MIKNILSKSHLTSSKFNSTARSSLNRFPKPRRSFTITTRRAYTNTMSSTEAPNSASQVAAASIPSSKPGEQFEVRQTHETEDYTPDPSKSLPLSPARQALVDDIIELYSCRPTIKRVERYTPDCVYDDQFVYANDRYKMAGQWYALPKGFRDSTNHGYQVVVNEPGLIQFRNRQSWTFAGPVAKTADMNALVSLSLDPATIDSDFIQVKYHKDQANDKDYSHEGIGFKIKKAQADKVSDIMEAEEVKYFLKDKDAAKTAPNTYGSGGKDGAAPVKDL